MKKLTPEQEQLVVDNMGLVYHCVSRGRRYRGRYTLPCSNYAEELADVIIASLSVAGKLGIDIDAEVRRKMQKNKERTWKHGKGETK